MMKKLLGLITVIVGMSFGQQSITLVAPSPTAVSNVSVTKVGNTGNTTNYIWVVANYGIGSANATISQAVINSPDSLSASNYLRVNWTGVANVVSYDILRTSVPFVSTPCTCAVTTGISASTLTYNIQSNSLSSYTLSPVGQATAIISLDNQTRTQPRVSISQMLNLPILGSFTIAAGVNQIPTSASTYALAFVVDGSDSSDCVAGGGSSLALCAFNGTSWVSVGGGGSGSVAPAYVSVAYSATPTFTITSTVIQGFAITLTGNAVVTVAGSPTTGQDVWLKVCQDGTGSRTFTLPANWTRTTAIDSSANACTTQLFRYDGTNFVGVTTGQSDSATPSLVTSAGVLLLPSAPDTIPGVGATNTFTGSNTFNGVVNASGATSTMPVKSGTVASLPATCSVGMVYFATNATAGQNLYFCTATNTWTQQLNSGGGGGGISSFTGSGASAVVAASTTTYFSNANTVPVTTEVQRASVMPRTCTAGSLYVVFGTQQPGTGNMVVTLRKNGAGTAVTLTATNANTASPPQTLSDTLNTVAFTAGDTWALEFANASPGNSSAVRGWGFICQ